MSFLAAGVDAVVKNEVAFSFRDYQFVAWTLVTALLGFWCLTRSILHPGHDSARDQPTVLAVALTPLPLAIFFGGMMFGALALNLGGQGLFGTSLSLQAVSSLAGQLLGTVILGGSTFLIPGSVRWAPSASMPGETMPPPFSAPSGAAEVMGAWRAFSFKTLLQCYLGLVALTVVAALLWKAFYFFCAQNGQTLPEEPQAIVELVANFDWSGPRLPIILFATTCAVGAPIVEELTFRGMLYPAMKGWLPRGYAVVLTGILFGVIHGSLSAFLPLAMFGAVLCIVRDRYGLLTCISLHAAFNFLTFFWLSYAPNAAMEF